MIKYFIFGILLSLVFTVTTYAGPKQIFVFSTDHCRYCVVLENDILAHPEIADRLEGVTVRHINRKDLNPRFLRAWKLKSYPTVVAVEIVNDTTAHILKRWQLRNTKRDDITYKNNRKSFLNFVEKYLPKKP